jgi:hypothetical protein
MIFFSLSFSSLSSFFFLLSSFFFLLSSFFFLLSSFFFLLSLSHTQSIFQKLHGYIKTLKYLFPEIKFDNNRFPKCMHYNEIFYYLLLNFINFFYSLFAFFKKIYLFMKIFHYSIVERRCRTPKVL